MKRKSCGAGLRCAPPHARPGEPLARLLRVGFRLSRAPMDTVLFARMLHVNVEAPFWLAQAAFPTMKQQRYGRIVLTTSGRAMFLESALPGLTSYALGKAAQLGLMNGLAAEGQEWGIRVNAISPAAATRMLRRTVGPGTFLPEHVAPAVAFLALAQCDVSGIVIRASNGQFSIARSSHTEEVIFGPGVVTPEAVAEWWNTLTGLR